MPYAGKLFDCEFLPIEDGDVTRMPLIQIRTPPTSYTQVRLYSQLLDTVGMNFYSLDLPFRSNRDAILPLSTPVRCTDGSIINEIPLPAGTNINVDILNANRNPELWGPDAMEWKPERWLSSLPPAVAEAKVPGIYAHL